MNTYIEQKDTVIDLIRRSGNMSYTIDFLPCIPVPVYPLREHASISGRHALLRHDVDHDLLHAYMMAVAEQRLSIRSTYYLLHPAGPSGTTNYFGRIEGSRIILDPTMLETAQHMQDMGHEIGLHNDLVSLALLARHPAADFLEQMLEDLRKNKIVIKGTASHGSALCRPNNYVNYHLFKECRGTPASHEKRNEFIELDGYTVPLYSLSASDYDLEYEAYFIKYDTYYSDSGNAHTFTCKGTTIKEPQANPHCITESFLDENIRTLQILIHPDHWDLRTMRIKNHYKAGVLSISKQHAEACLQEHKQHIAHLPSIVFHDDNLVTINASYNEVYASNKNHFTQPDSIVKFVKKLMEESPQTNVLELGCGQGDFISLCVQDIPDVNYVLGMDGSYAGIVDAAMKYPKHHWVIAEGVSFLKDMMEEKHIERGIPRTFSTILEKTGLTAIADFETAFTAAKYIHKLVENNGLYIFIAAKDFYATKYLESGWPMHWVQILSKVFGNATQHDVGGYYVCCYRKTA